MADPSHSMKITATESDADVEGVQETALPAVLVERLSLIADTFGQSETQFVKTALREQIDAMLDSERVKRRIESDFYAGNLSYENLVLLVGQEEANAYRYLKERLHREPDELPGDPVDEDVYGDFDSASAPTPVDEEDERT